MVISLCMNFWCLYFAIKYAFSKFWGRNGGIYSFAFEINDMEQELLSNISDGDKDVYCVLHGLLVSTHGNFKPNVYHVHIKK